MEFIIEELSSQPERRVKPHLSQALIRRLQKGCDAIKSRLQSFFRALSIRGELGIASIIVIGIVGSLVGRDLWHINQQKLEIKTLQQIVRELSLQQQAIQHEARPIIDYIQRQWLREREENVGGLLRLFISLENTFQPALLIHELQKKAQDPTFYLQGEISDHSMLLQLETLLQSLNWQSVVTLLPNHSSLFQWTLLPLHRRAFNE